MQSKIKILSENDAYRGYVAVRKFRLQFQNFDGGWSAELDREAVLRADAAIILPYDPIQDRVLMIEQFRLPGYCCGVDPWMLELPAGSLDCGETPEQVAVRETFEETGLDIDRVKFLHKFLASPGILAETLHLYAGRIDLSPLSRGHAEVHGKAEEGENIRLRPVAFSDIPMLLNDGKVINSPAMLGLYWLLANRDQLRKEWL